MLRCALFTVLLSNLSIFITDVDTLFPVNHLPDIFASHGKCIKPPVVERLVVGQHAMNGV